MSVYFLIIFFLISSGFVPQIEQKQPDTFIEIVPEKDSIVLDLRYATLNNFTHQVLYDCPRCYLRKEVALALKTVQNALDKKGYGLKVFDCYRPLTIQQKMWRIVPDPHYVANPKKGSMHNRGQAVDLTLVDKEGQELDMGTSFDYFGKEAHWAFKGLSPEVLKNRQILLKAMEAAGFKHIRTEWWHFSMRNLPNSKLYSWEWDCLIKEQDN